MPTLNIGFPSEQDQEVTQFLSVAAVLTAFPTTTLSGAAANRFKTALGVLAVTPANANIRDEEGDVLCISFLSAAAGKFIYLTQKGKRRVELEAGASQGY